MPTVAQVRAGEIVGCVSHRQTRNVVGRGFLSQLASNATRAGLLEGSDGENGNGNTNKNENENTNKNKNENKNKRKNAPRRRCAPAWPTIRLLELISGSLLSETNR